MQGDHAICSQMWLWIYTPPYYPRPPPPQKKKKEKRNESLVFAIEIFKRQALFFSFF